MSTLGPAESAPRPLVPNGVLAMAIFVATEAMFFAGLISALLVLRAQAPDWPPADQPRLPVGVTGVNTAILLASGWSMARAAAAARRRQPQALSWLALTAGLGGIFLMIQGYEWVRLVSFGLTTGSSLYGATFYTLVGAHGLHVLAALIALAFLVHAAARRGLLAARPEAIEPYRIYWTFVVAVWPILYVLVYLR